MLTVGFIGGAGVLGFFWLVGFLKNSSGKLNQLGTVAKPTWCSGHVDLQTSDSK